MSRRISISHGWNVLRLIVPFTSSASSLLNRFSTTSGSWVSTDISTEDIGGRPLNLKCASDRRGRPKVVSWKGPRFVRGRGCDPFGVDIRDVKLLVVIEKRPCMRMKIEVDGATP